MPDLNKFMFMENKITVVCLFLFGLAFFGGGKGRKGVKFGFFLLFIN